MAKSKAKTSSSIIKSSIILGGYRNLKQFASATGIGYKNFWSHCEDPGSFSGRQLAAIVSESDMSDEQLGKLMRAIANDD